MRFDNTVERIYFYLSLLSDASDIMGGHEFIIAEVSSKFDIPKTVIREDIGYMLKQPGYSGICVKFDVDSDNENIAGGNLKQRIVQMSGRKREREDANIEIGDFLEHEGITFNEFLLELSNGKYDEERFFVSKMFWNAGSENYMFPVSNSEKAIVGRMFQGGGELYTIKEMPCQPDRRFRKKIAAINSAILNGNIIRCDYIDAKTGDSAEVLLRPYKIRIDSLNIERSVCIRENGALMRISRMNNVKEIENPAFKEPESPDINDDWDAIWGLPSDKDTIEGQTHHVVIQIKADTANIIDKIKADTARRVNAEFRDVGENLYIYEDDISGFMDFKRWIWSYGSAVKVIEPKWLAEQIADDYNRIREQYRTGKFIVDD
mgnify:CR=1 FL=1